MSMQVYCQHGSELYCIDTDPDDTVGGLKEAIYRTLRLTVENRCLVHDSVELDDDDVLLCDTAILPESTVEIVMSEKEVARMQLREMSIKRNFKSVAHAAETGNVHHLQLLHTAGVDVFQQERDTTALLLGLAHPEVRDYLLALLGRSGASYVNQGDSRGSPALMHACWQGDLQLVEALVAAGADPCVQNQDRDTPLIWAAMNGHSHILTFLNPLVAKNPDWLETRRQAKGAVQAAKAFQQYHVVEYLEQRAAEARSKHTDPCAVSVKRAVKQKTRK